MNHRPKFAPEGQPIDVDAARFAAKEAMALGEATLASASPALKIFALVMLTLSSGIDACLDEIVALREKLR